MGTIRKTHQDTPVLHNSNQEGIRTGMVLTGFEGFTATSERSNNCDLSEHIFEFIGKEIIVGGDVLEIHSRHPEDKTLKEDITITIIFFIKRIDF